MLRWMTLTVLCAALSSGQQKLDEGYTAKIRSATTAPEFLTDLVDHLPASARVPTPEKFLGYISGAENQLTYAKDVHRYFREVAKATPRVRVETLGTTEEGREMIVAFVSDETNLKRLDRLKEITAKLADPRRTPEAEARRLMREGVPLYWLTAAIHAPETGAPEMLMELVYRLAVEESERITEIRKNVVVMITPVVEVDGREKQVDLYRWHRAHLGEITPSLAYWGKYVGHDNNRDGMAISLKLSQNVTRGYLANHPQVLHDLHESVPFLYISTGMGPYNAWFDPIETHEWQQMAWNEVNEMTKRGVPGVWTWGYYDGWGANYLMEAAHGHNSIGRFYETYGNGGADTSERVVPKSVASRAWYRENPPYERVKWSHRNNVNLQQSAVILALSYTARNKQTFLENFYLKSRRAVAKATTEGPAAYVLDPRQRPHETASLVELLQRHGVEVQRLANETEVAGVKHPAGAFVVRMDQPYSRMADMLLDRQYYSPSDPMPFDDAGWTLPAARNLKWTRVTDVAILKAAMAPAEGRLVPAGGVVGSGRWYAVNHNGDRVLARFRFELKDVRMKAAEEGFEAAGRKFAAGSFLIAADGAVARVKQVAETLGLEVVGLAAEPKVATHELAAPRIALVHGWMDTQNEGWARLALENAGVPYTYISDRVVKETAKLRDRFDVILFGPTGADPRRIVNGIPERGNAIPWKATELTPNFATAPDQTEDMRGGLGLEGLVNIRRFVEAGGLFITIGGNAALPIDYGLVEGVSVQATRELKTRGSLLDAEVSDAKSPVTYGYDKHLPVYFNAAPVFNVNLSRGPRDEGGERVTGRGGVDDPDVIQGRPLPAPVDAKAERRDPLSAERMRMFETPAAERPRAVLRFGVEKDLLVSGLLAGGKELAGKPAIVDIPRGQGHYLLFAINPMWREQTQGSLMLLMNAAMNYASLGVGHPPAEKGK
jgi:hypothetical protein